MEFYTWPCCIAEYTNTFKSNWKNQKIIFNLKSREPEPEARLVVSYSIQYNVYNNISIFRDSHRGYYYDCFLRLRVRTSKFDRTSLSLNIELNILCE